MRKFLKTGAAIALVASFAFAGNAMAFGGGGHGGGFGGGHAGGFGGGHAGGFGGGHGGGYGGGFGYGGFGYGAGLGYGGYGYDDAFGYDNGGYGYGQPYGYSQPGVQYGDDGQGLQTGRSAAVPGDSCTTPVISCQLSYQNYVGAPCSCRISGGHSHGRVTQ